MIVGTSPAMQQLMKIVVKVARTDANILITGENGTGKEMLAQEIHRLSTRKEHFYGNGRYGSNQVNLYSKVNCSGMSAVLLPMPTRAGRESLKRHPAVPCLWMK